VQQLFERMHPLLELEASESEVPYDMPKYRKVISLKTKLGITSQRDKSKG
jgi:hypothetical protein